LSLGWRELISSKKNIVIVEWAERVKKIIPPARFGSSSNGWIKMKEKLGFITLANPALYDKNI